MLPSPLPFSAPVHTLHSSFSLFGSLALDPQTQHSYVWAFIKQFPSLQSPLLNSPAYFQPTLQFPLEMPFPPETSFDFFRLLYELQIRVPRESWASPFTDHHLFLVLVVELPAFLAGPELFCLLTLGQIPSTMPDTTCA